MTQPGLEPELLAPESSMLIIRPTHLPLEGVHVCDIQGKITVTLIHCHKFMLVDIAKV